MITEDTIATMPDSFMLWRPQTDTVVEDANVHSYLYDGFFSSDSIFQTEVSTPDVGTAGDPVPYTLRSDNMLTLILLFCFMLFVVSVAHSKRFLLRQVKNFFFVPHNDEVMDETSGELRFQLFLGLLCCLLLAISTYLYITQTVTRTFLLDNDFQLIAILFAAMVVYFASKWLLYTIVNNIFFDSKRNLQWSKAFLFITAAEGVVLFPIVMLLIYFNLTVQNSIYFFVFVLLVVKILTFYKCWSIFFRRNGGLLQTFLYFCTLEVTPLLIFGGGLTILIDVLRINF